MSGPKVVRIVTREEMESIKASHVSRLESLVNEIKTYAEQKKLFNDDQIKEIESRLEKYRHLDASEYRKIESEIPSQIEFLENEKERLETSEKKRVVSRRDKSRHLIASIKSLKAMHDKRSMHLPEKILNIEKNSQLLWLSDEEIENIESSISEAFSNINHNQQRKLNKESEALSQRLNQNQDVVRFSEWLMQVNLVKLTASQHRLESIIVELKAQDITAGTKRQFIERSNELFTEESSQQLDMKIDSLSIEISSFIKEFREKAKKLREYHSILNDLKRIDANKSKYEKLKLKNYDWASIEETDNAISKLTKLLEEEMSQRSSDNKRKVLLSAFEKLGYTINEEMETAFVQDGRLVVNKNSGSPYGVELGSPSNLKRLQLRVVSNKEANIENTSENDIAAEEAWCEDFNKIKTDFLAQGVFIEIDKQFQPGETSVKKVAFEDDRWVSANRKTAKTNKVNQKIIDH